jgi:hypothetical protein
MFKLITIDFDDTLCLFDDESGPRVNPAMLERIKFHRDIGDHLVILTTRFDTNLQFVRDFVEHHDIKVESIWATNGKTKGEWLIEQGISPHIHFDNDTFDIISVIVQSPSTTVFTVDKTHIMACEI